MTVVPASAGVFHAVLDWWLADNRRPRQRGGVPAEGSALEFLSRSSPPARGCSACVHHDGRGRWVVPASAGVFPVAESYARTVAGRPRQRGGVP